MSETVGSHYHRPQRFKLHSEVDYSEVANIEKGFDETVVQAMLADEQIVAQPGVRTLEEIAAALEDPDGEVMTEKVKNEMKALFEHISIPAQAIHPISKELVEVRVMSKGMVLYLLKNNYGELLSLSNYGLEERQWVGIENYTFTIAELQLILSPRNEIRLGRKTQIVYVLNNGGLETLVNGICRSNEGSKRAFKTIKYLIKVSKERLAEKIHEAENRRTTAPIEDSDSLVNQEQYHQITGMLETLRAEAACTPKGELVISKSSLIRLFDIPEGYDPQIGAVRLTDGEAARPLPRFTDSINTLDFAGKKRFNPGVEVLYLDEEEIRLLLEIALIKGFLR